MQYFIDSKGTTINLITDPIYQGSTNANELVLVAPISPNNQVTCAFRLPNGIETEERLMKLQGVPMNIEGKIYYVWRSLLDGIVTEYAGQVQVQFTLYQGAFRVGNIEQQIKPKTYTSAFTVGVGVTPTMPPTPEPNIYQAILNYLAELNPQYNIKDVIYSTKPDQKINTDNVTLSRTPSDSVLKWNVSFEPSNIASNEQGANKPPLYALDADYAENTGFTIDFAEPVNIGKMQMNLYGAYNVTQLDIYVKLNGALDYKEAKSFIFQTNEGDTYILRNINENNVVSIKIIQPYTENYNLDEANGVTDKGYTKGRFYVRSIDLWKPNTDGEITITSTTGQTIASFPDVDNSSVLTQMQGYADRAEQAEQGAKKAEENTKTSEQGANQALATLTSQKNEPNGVAGLDANGQISAGQIPAIVKHDYFEVSSQEALTTLTQAEIGDVGYLLDETGTKVVNSWILLGNGDYSILSNWKEQSTQTAGSAAYADQAGTALDSQKINGLAINGILSEDAYNSLTSEQKQGVYFVSITE